MKMKINDYMKYLCVMCHWESLCNLLFFLNLCVLILLYSFAVAVQFVNFQYQFCTFTDSVSNQLAVKMFTS